MEFCVEIIPNQYFNKVGIMFHQRNLQNMLKLDNKEKKKKLEKCFKNIFSVYLDHKEGKRQVYSFLNIM